MPCGEYMISWSSKSSCAPSAGRAMNSIAVTRSALICCAARTAGSTLIAGDRP
jgi:hypothetical protein